MQGNAIPDFFIYPNWTFLIFVSYFRERLNDCKSRIYFSTHFYACNIKQVPVGAQMKPAVMKEVRVPYGISIFLFDVQQRLWLHFFVLVSNFVQPVLWTGIVLMPIRIWLFILILIRIRILPQVLHMLKNCKNPRPTGLK